MRSLSCALTALSSFRTNAAQYTAQLEALHTWVDETISSIPSSSVYWSLHTTPFHIMAARMALRSLVSKASVLSPRRGLLTSARWPTSFAERKVPAVFIESTINPRTVQSVIDATAQRGHQVEIGGTLYSDAMGEDGTAGGTYIGMIYENTSSITQALGGSVPPLPEALSAWAEQWDVETAAR
jgi:manganese/zinc/iron transport system substrate-binding protein